MIPSQQKPPLEKFNNLFVGHHLVTPLNTLKRQPFSTNFQSKGTQKKGSKATRYEHRKESTALSSFEVKGAGSWFVGVDGDGGTTKKISSSDGWMEKNCIWALVGGLGLGVRR